MDVIAYFGTLSLSTALHPSVCDRLNMVEGVAWFKFCNHRNGNKRKIIPWESRTHTKYTLLEFRGIKNENEK